MSRGVHVVNALWPFVKLNAQGNIRRTFEMVYRNFLEAFESALRIRS